MLADDPSVSIVAQDVAYERVPAVLGEHRPSVLILAAAGLRDLAEIRELSLAHPDTHLVLFSEDLAAVEQAQLLAFGASACLAWSTQARDVRNAIHLASRGLQISPRQVAEETPGRTKDPLLTPREGDVCSCCATAWPTGRSRSSCTSASRRCARMRATSTASSAWLRGAG